MEHPRALLSVEEAATQLGVSRSTMYEIIKSGEIETVKVGRLRRVPADAIDAYIATVTGREAAPHASLSSQPKEPKRAPRSRVDAATQDDVKPTVEPAPVALEPISKARDPKPRQKRAEGTRAPNGESSVYFSEADGWWHGWVTVGVRDNGRPDRRHRKARSERDIKRKVRELEQERDKGRVREAGPVWTVEKWLTHWVENVAALTVRDSTLSSYRVAVFHHLIPGLGAHRIDKIKPEHFERFYTRMTERGAKPATAHQVHRTARTAFGVAERRGYITRNPVALAAAPRIEDEEIEPYTVEETRLLIETALKRRNGVRWVIALVTGLRQGEVLGLQWPSIDLDEGNLRVRKNRLRPKYAHGCTEPCGKKFPGYCPARKPIRPKVGAVKSKAAKRPFPLPMPLVDLLKVHQAAQEAERVKAGDLWLDEGWVIATETGDAVNPRTDWDDWKDLLKEADVREGRLHDARHTAATIAMIAGILDRTAQELFGWSDANHGKRYRHVVAPVQRDAADRIGTVIWPVQKPDGDGNATQTATVVAE